MILDPKALPEQIKIGQAIDLTNQRFEKLKVLYRCEKPLNAKSRGAYWCCKCDCGNYTVVRADSLKNKAIISCGCEGAKRRGDAIKINITNQRFGELVALYPTDKRENSSRGCVMWHCKCDCGNEIDIPSTALTTGNSTSCGHHHQSKGARYIENLLIQNNIIYEKEKTFQGCQDKGLLRFDFYLPSYNICIEFDGEQHFNSAKSGYFHDELKNIQRRDQIKNEYCQNNNIVLIRVPYYNINNIDINDLIKE